MKKLTECIICRSLVKDESVYETKYWQVTLSSDQFYLGRCYVSLKRHCGSLSKLNKLEWLDFLELIKTLEQTLEKSFGATPFNWTCLMNDAYQNTPPNPHVHWHFRPRYKNKVKFAGIVFEDLGFGHHYDRTKLREVSEGVKKEIIERIKKNIK